MPFKFPKFDKLLKMKYNFNPILHNQVVLYLFLFMTVVQIVLFVGNNDITSIVLMCLVGILASFFSKNMIVILCIVLTVTNLLKQGLKKFGYEGFEDKKEDGEATMEDGEATMKDAEPKKEDAKAKKDEAEIKKDDSKSKKNDDEIDEYDIPNSNESSEKTKDEMKKQFEELKKDYPEFKELQDDLLEGLKKMDPLLDKAEAFMNKYSQYSIDKK
jgi:ssDNA-binding Zn-finger/Zn-ribbon topoisomerase 1